MGSSIVMMWSARVSLIRLIIAASVDDLPEPVGPVTSTMPFLSSAISASRGGRLSSASVGIFVAMTRITIAYVPRWRKTLTRKRAQFGIPYEKSQAPCSLSARSACSLPLISSQATRAVCSGWSTAIPGTWTPIRSPCRSICDGRPGEKIRSLMPSPASSIARIIAGASLDAPSPAPPKSARSRSLTMVFSVAMSVAGAICVRRTIGVSTGGRYGVSLTIQGLMPSARARRAAASSAAPRSLKAPTRTR